MNYPTTIQQSFSVTYEYAVEFTENIFNPANHLLKNHIAAPQKLHDKKIKALICIDEGVIQAHPKLTSDIQSYFNYHQESIELIADFVRIRGGEQAKNDFALVKKIYEYIESDKICRHSIIIAIGGGSVIDMVGYCAATAHRGVRLVRIPTTLLSQTDASVGVKNSINYLNKKNFIGTFAIPFLVINDYTFLTTLSDKILLEGISEAIKVALIKDASFFRYLQTHTLLTVQRNKATIQNIIYTCARLHLEHISQGGDPFEKGSSRPLDFGHWSAHKLEQLSNYTISHGQAVAIGISLDCTYAFLKGYMSEQILKSILNVFLNLHLAIFSSFLLKTIINGEDPAVFNGLEEFREHLGGQLTILLIQKPGESFEVHQIDRKIMKEAILHLQQYTKHHPGKCAKINPN